MATLASLNIALTANSAKLKKDLDKAKGHTKNFAAQQKKTFSTLTKAMTGVGLAISAVTAGISKSLGASAEAAKDLKKMSDLTGASTDRLQQVEPALFKAGVSLEKYSDILKDTNDKIHDFLQTGGGPLKDFFEQIAPSIGVTKEQFAGLSGEQGLQLYVSSLEKANLSQEQMTFYMEAIASDSTMLLPLLKDNAAGMNEFGSSVASAMTPETIENLLTMSTNFKLLKTTLNNLLANNLSGWAKEIGTWLGVYNARLSGTLVVTSHFSEALDNATLAMGDEIDQANKLFTLLGTGTTISQSAAVATLSTAKAHLRAAEAKHEEAEAEKALQMALLQTEYHRRKTLLDSIGNSKINEAAREEQEQGLVILLKRMAELKASGAGFKEELELAEAEVERIQAGIDGATDGMVTFDGELVTANELSSRLSGTLGDMEMGSILIQAQELAKKLNISYALAMGIANIGGAGGAMGPDQAKAQVNKQFNMQDLIANGTVTKITFPASKGGGGGGGGGGVSKEAKKSADLLEDAVEKIKDQQEKIKTIGDNFLDGVADGFVTALKTGDWKSFLNSTLDQLTSDIITNFVDGLFKPLKDMLSEGIGNLMNGLSSGGGGGLFGLFGGLFGGGASGLANGGQLISGPALLGAADGGIVPTTPFSKSYADSVPTMLQPGELVVPVDQVDSFMNGGGGGQTFNISVTGDVTRATRREIVAMMPQIASSTNALNKENGIR